MKTTDKHFALFKQECEKWIDKLELHNWRVYYQHTGIKDFANTTFDAFSGVATIRLNTDWDEVRPLTKDSLAHAAKHEVLHLLTGKLWKLATLRWVTEFEIDSAEHEIVRKLEQLI